MNKHEKFLEFNGHKIYFIKVNGIYWISLKSICLALNIDADRSIKNVKKDEILGSEWSKQTIQVSKNGKNQGRKMSCLTEKYIYGWIFSLRSDSSDLKEYKKTCYELLYNHFHGTIINRKELLVERNEIDTQIHNIKENLKTNDVEFKKLEQLQIKKKQVNFKLNNIDKELVKEPELF